MSENAAGERTAARGVSYDWGYRLGHRMMKQNNVPPKAPSATTKRMLAEFPPSEADIDLRGLVHDLSDVEMWEGACAVAAESAGLKKKQDNTVAEWCERALVKKQGDWDLTNFPVCGGGRSLNLCGWKKTVQMLRPLRALALALGSSLTALDLSETSVGDADLECLCSRLFSLRSMKLKMCPKVGNLGAKILAASSSENLRSLELAGCSSRLTHDACGWLAGELGASRCSRLSAIDLSRCVKMDDLALKYLSRGCTRLRYVNLAYLPTLTEIGLTALAKGCRKLSVLDVTGCPRIGNAALKALGGDSHDLRTLLASHCGGSFSDAGLRSIARGCPKLAYLSVAGSALLSEAVFGELVSRCRALGTLNLTGCSEVTVNGLDALVAGVGFVTKATTFFGFVPLEEQDESRDHLRRAQRDLENRSSSLIAVRFKEYRQVLEDRLEAVKQRRRKAEDTADRIARKWLYRERGRVARLKKKQLRSTLNIQRVYRGHKGRSLIKEDIAIRARERLYGPRFIPYQALSRGYFTRKRDPASVTYVIRRTRFLQRRRRRDAAATKIAALGRGKGQRRRLRLILQLRARRDDDILWAARVLQHEIRGMLAKWAVTRRRDERARWVLLQNAASRTITAFIRKVSGNALLDKLKRELGNRKQQAYAAAVLIQRWTHGFFGRLQGRELKRESEARRAAATVVQRNFRCTRVLDFKKIRMNKIALEVQSRVEVERAGRQRDAWTRKAAWLAEVQRDSASEDEEDDKSQAWVETTALRGVGNKVVYWSNTITGETADFDPGVPDPVDTELVGCSVKIFWPRMAEWYEGSIVKFNRRKKRYRVLYDDGDHEWLDLHLNENRVQLFDGNNQWAMFSNAHRPQLVHRKIQEAEREKLKLRSKKLEDESRCWEVLYQEPSLDAKVEVPKERWFNSMTGQTRFLSEDKGWWLEARDEADNFCFQHGETLERVYDRDPRLEPDLPMPLEAERQDNCLEELRFAVYLCSAHVDDWERGDEQKKLSVQRQVDGARELRMLQNAVTQARAIWDEGRSFEESPELQHAVAVLQAVTVIADVAQRVKEDQKLFKRALIANSRRHGTISCATCGADQESSARSHCANCGERLGITSTAVSGDSTIATAPSLMLLMEDDGSFEASITPEDPPGMILRTGPKNQNQILRTGPQQQHPMLL